MNSIGRPTKFNQSIITRTDEYISSCSREQTELPTIEGLALYLNINDDTINEWSKRYPGFSAIIKKLKNRQKNQLINDGLYGTGQVSTAMAIFLLKAQHGMVETEHKVFSFDKDAPLNIEIKASYKPIEVKSTNIQLTEAR